MVMNETNAHTPQVRDKLPDPPSNLSHLLLFPRLLARVLPAKHRLWRPRPSPLPSPRVSSSHDRGADPSDPAPNSLSAPAPGPRPRAPALGDERPRSGRRPSLDGSDSEIVQRLGRAPVGAGGDTGMRPPEEPPSSATRSRSPRGIPTPSCAPSGGIKNAASVALSSTDVEVSSPAPAAGCTKNGSAGSDAPAVTEAGANAPGWSPSVAFVSSGRLAAGTRKAEGGTLLAGTARGENANVTGGTNVDGAAGAPNSEEGSSVGLRLVFRELSSE